VLYVNGTNASSRNPQVRFLNEGSYDVSLTTTNNAGSGTLVKQKYINLGGFKMPFTEDFESGTFSSRSWTIFNPDNKTGWDVAATGGHSSGTKSARMDIYHYALSQGQRDRLISPVFDFSSSTNVQLSFEHAYAKRYAPLTDSLIVLVSDDCGISWTRVFATGENNSWSFSTAPLTNTPFIPSTSDDWCGNGLGSQCNSIDLSAWAGKKNIKLAFESYDRLGNNIYLDNISISSNTDISKVPLTDSDLSVFPNPSKGLLTIYSSKAIMQEEVSIINSRGMVVYTGKFSSGPVGTMSIDISTLPKGLYFVRLNADSVVQVKKIILE
jgi:hypothetical protein